jgi:hypothetical protein
MVGWTDERDERGRKVQRQNKEKEKTLENCQYVLRNE